MSAPGPTGEALLTVVIPVYNEQDVLPLLRKRLDAVLDGLDIPSEVLLVDDGSRDGTTSLLRALAADSKRYGAVVLSRNYGHQIALTAGLEHAKGDVIVVLDADL